MKQLALLLSLLLSVLLLSAQDCESFFPVDKGTFTEMKNYDAKGKLTGTVRQTVTDVSTVAGELVIKVQSEQLDKKDESLGTQDLEMRCKDGVFYMDMKNFYNQAAMGNTEGAEMTIDAKDLMFPANIKPGETLPDGSMTMSFASGPIPMNMSINIFNRKVEAIENITTPAGTFEAYKISYDIEMKVPIKITSKAIQWYAKNAGAVRTESYNKAGKLMGYSELTTLRK